MVLAVLPVQRRCFGLGLRFGNPIAQAADDVEVSSSASHTRGCDKAHVEHARRKDIPSRTKKRTDEILREHADYRITGRIEKNVPPNRGFRAAEKPRGEFVAQQNHGWAAGTIFLRQKASSGSRLHA